MNGVERFTGIVRRVDSMGRVVLPVDLRRTLHLPLGTPLSIYVRDDEGVVLRRSYEDGCIFCGATGGSKGLGTFHGKPVCAKCLAELKGELFAETGERSD